MSRRVTIVVGLALALPVAAQAQWGDFLQKKLDQTARREAGKAIDQSADAAYDAAKKGVKGEPRRDEPPPPRQGSRQDGVDPGARRAPGGGGEPARPADEVAAGEVYGNRFDFVPGDKVLVFDDLAETEVGDYPARWTIKDGGGNPTEVVSYQGRKWWKSVRTKDQNEASMHWLRFDPKGDMPQKFTIELDADMGGEFSVVFNKQRAWGGQEIEFNRESVTTPHVKAAIQPYGSVVKRVSISVNGTYAKVYVGGTRVLQDPDAVQRPIKRLGFRFDAMYRSRDGDRLDHQMMTAFRLAEGGKDVAQAVNAEGRIVVHGIYFDTGSDVIRPESGGALRTILQLLEGDPSLRFRIEGHTDDQGGSTVNGPLSERRAASVKAWLVSQGVDPKRLEPKGFGATRPIDANTTQEGRANNRRVEFVRIAATS